MDLVDDLDLPEVDPAYPEPDFFDAQDVMMEMNVVVGDNQLLSETSRISSRGLQQLNANAPGSDVAGVKYDDELCEFNEFLLPASGATTVVGDPETNDKEVSTTEEEEEDVRSTNKAVSSGISDAEEMEDQDDDDAPNANKDKDETLLKSSVPKAPESKAASATIHLINLPKPKIEPRRISIPRESPSKKSLVSNSSASPPRRTRSAKSALDKTVGREGGLKRKLSESDDYQIEIDDEENVDLEPESKRLTYSGRQTRKMSRYGSADKEKHFDEGDKSVKRNHVVSKRGRQVKKPARYDVDNDDGFQSDEDAKPRSEDENLFVPFKRKKLALEVLEYWEKNGIWYCKDREENVWKFPPCSVLLRRLSKEEVEQAKAIIGCPSDVDVKTVNDRILLEVCIDNFESAVEAIKGGAKRIELCSSLMEGGLTPSTGFLKLIKEKFEDIPVFVMIRPRGGDFIYTPDEIEIMSRDIAHFKEIGADGFVFGALTKNCDIDVQNCRLLKEVASPLPCTFHRAFDKLTEPFSALEKIIDMGFARILTSGLAPTAHAGIPKLKRFVEVAKNRIIILAGAGVNATNVAEIVKRTRVQEVHGSASKSVRSLMCAPSTSNASNRNTRGRRGKRSTGAQSVKMGATDDSVIKVTDSTLVAKIIRNAHKC